MGRYRMPANDRWLRLAFFAYVVFACVSALRIAARLLGHDVALTAFDALILVGLPFYLRLHVRYRDMRARQNAATSEEEDALASARRKLTEARAKNRRKPPSQPE